MIPYQKVSGVHPLLFKLLVALLVAALLLGYLPQSQGSALAAGDKKPACNRPYVVRSGDTLNKITKAYKLSFKELVAENSLHKPYIIYVGQKLCLSDTKKEGPIGATTKDGNALAASFTVAFHKTTLTISTRNFPTRNSFFVKLDDTKLAGYQWVKAGTLRTKDKSKGSYTFILPKEFRKSGIYTVCLKNLTSDVQVCKTIPYAGK